MRLKELSQIPFLPVSFFKTHRVTGNFDPEIIFESSGTTGTVNSNHLVKDLDYIRKALLKGLKSFMVILQNGVLLACCPLTSREKVLL